MEHITATPRTSMTVALVLVAGLVSAETYTVDPVHSAVDFSIRHTVGRVKGRFTEFSGTVTYDPPKPEVAQFTAAVQTKSIDTGNERRDNHLRSPDFFDAEKYPTITFQSTKVVRSGEGLLQVTGKLTLHGVTREVVLPVELLGTGTHPMSGKPQVGFATQFTVKRSDYGVNHWIDAEAVVGDEVKVEVLVEANAG